MIRLIEEMHVLGVLFVLALSCCCCCCLLFCAAYRRRTGQIKSETAFGIGSTTAVDQYHPRGFARFGSSTLTLSRLLRRARGPTQREIIAATAEALRSARDEIKLRLRNEAMEASRGRQAREQLSAEQLPHARRQLGGEQARRKEASAAAKARLEAAAAQLAEAETEVNSAAQAK